MNIKDLELLQTRLTKKKICVMGIGNFDRADDYAGVAVAEQLEKTEFPKNITIINAGPVPEAFTSVIKRFKPKLLIIIDATDMKEEVGSIRVFTENNIKTVPMITPHNTPMTMFVKYLNHFLDNLETVFIGIQPASLRYGEKMSNQVKESVAYLSGFLEEQLLAV
ncbi:MAG: hydrogenase maturation protease [Candidatus Heimdallarchaeota archaeon]|nr:hydrogenase maturation protease [Candidatus Heimdallarchaeota archaeon]